MSGAARGALFALAAIAILGACGLAEARCKATPPQRCLRPGDQDPQFGNFGYAAFYDLGNGLSRGAMDMVVLPDGRIVMGGSSTTDGGVNHDPTLARFTAGGLPDDTFGSDGVVRMSLGPGNAIIQSVARQSDGKILVAGGYDANPLRIPGYTTGYVPDTSFLARFEEDGAPDTTFGSGGSVVVSTPGMDRSYERMLLQSDGKILTVGFQGGATAETTGYFVERRDDTGALDPSFGAGGVALAAGSGFRWSPYYRAGAAIQSDGKIVVGGASFKVGPFLNCAVARFDTDGSLDASFGDGGQVVLPQNAGEVCNIQSIAQQADGRLLASGAFYGDPSKMTFSLMRLGSDGTFDVHFGKKGHVQTRIVNESVTVTSHAVALQADGAIVEAGSAAGGEFDLARLKPRGGRDARFGSHQWLPGTVRTGRPGPVTTAVFDGAQAVQILPSGRILVGGNPGHQSTFALARYVASTCLYDPVAHTVACE